MIGEPLTIRYNDMQDAAFVVRMAFSLYDVDDGLLLVRSVFDEMWPAWTDVELVAAMRAALVEH